MSGSLKTPTPSPAGKKDPAFSQPSRNDIFAAAYLTPPSSASPRRQHFLPTTALESELLSPRPRVDATTRRDGAAHRPRPRSPAASKAERRRAASLSAAYTDDKNSRPLDILRRENKLAYKAPHLRRRHLPAPDTIDRLDNVWGAYHHEGPYDATLYARNSSAKISPVQAVQSTNEEALKATPLEAIQDSLLRHRPLDGVAVIPSGMTDFAGRRMDYVEGPNMMVEHGGNYKRWPGVDYHPDDIKGKGEPSYTVEKALKQHRHARSQPGSETGYEMAQRLRSSSVGQSGQAQAHARPSGPHAMNRQSDIHRSQTTGRLAGKTLRRRLGSLSK